MNLDENLRIQLEKERNETIMKGSELSPAPDMNSENFSKNVRFLSHKNKSLLIIHKDFPEKIKVKGFYFRGKPK